MSTIIFKFKNIRCQYKCLALSKRLPASILDLSVYQRKKKPNSNSLSLLCSPGIHPWTSQSKMNSLFSSCFCCDELFIVEADLKWLFLHLSFLSIYSTPAFTLTSRLIISTECSYNILFLPCFILADILCCLHVNIHVYSLFSYFTGNFKAVYQRARAHAALCNGDEARRDFSMVERLDPQFKPIVRQELKKLCENIRVMNARQNKTYWDMTQEKWGPHGSKAQSAARKKNVKFSQKAADEKTKAGKKTEDGRSKEKESSEKGAPAEREAADDTETEKNPDVKAEQSNKEPECGKARREGIDNENTERVVVHEAGPGAPDNRATDKDSGPAPTSSGKDNVASKRSARDKARKKVKCQSQAAQDPGRTSSGNKATGGGTKSGGTPSE